jgi:hypothetical protein
MTISAFFLCTTLLSIQNPSPNWWNGDPTKEVTSIKTAVDSGLGQKTTTGYENAKTLLPLIKEARIKNSTSGGDPATLAKLIALVYRARTAIGIEEEPIFTAVRKDIDFQLFGWTKKVDSLSFMKVCILFVYEFGNEGKFPPILTIKKLSPYLADDLYFQEALVNFMTFHLDDFRKSEVATAARNLAKSKRGVYIHARVAGFALNNLALKHKDKALMAESIGLLEKYLEGMQSSDRSERKKWENWVTFSKKKLAEWK